MPGLEGLLPGFEGLVCQVLRGGFVPNLEGFVPGFEGLVCQALRSGFLTGFEGFGLPRFKGFVRLFEEFAII